MYTVHSYHNDMHNLYISLFSAGVDKALQKSYPLHIYNCLQNLQIYPPTLQIVNEIHYTSDEDLWPTFTTSLAPL